MKLTGTFTILLAISTQLIFCEGLPGNMTGPNFQRPEANIHQFSAPLGINCRGSSYCSPCYIQDFSIADIADVTNIGGTQLPPGYNKDTTYRNQQQIYCTWVRNCYSKSAHSSFCLFPQHMREGQRITLGEVHELVKKLRDHGCQSCGSVPLAALHGSNDPSEDGILTFNFVSNPHGCKEFCLKREGARD